MESGNRHSSLWPSALWCEYCSLEVKGIREPSNAIHGVWLLNGGEGGRQSGEESGGLQMRKSVHPQIVLNSRSSHFSPARFTVRAVDASTMDQCHCSGSTASRWLSKLFFICVDLGSGTTSSTMFYIPRPLSPKYYFGLGSPVADLAPLVNYKAVPRIRAYLLCRGFWALKASQKLRL